MKSLLALAMLATLTACGGGSDPEPSATTPQSTPVVVSRTTIDLFGDSTLNQVAPLIAARYPGRVRNRAVPGTNSSQLIAGTDGLNAPWPGSVRSAAVVINHGLNDGWAAHQVLTQDEYRANLERLIDSAPAGVQVLLQTPLPSTAPGRDMAPYAETMRTVARERGLVLVDVYACFSAAPGYASLFVDHVHATPAGLEVMAACMAPALDAL